MTEEERRAWIRMLAVLLVAAGLRMAWDSRAARAATPGLERNAAAALDTVDALAAEAARRSQPLGPAEQLDPNHADPIELDRLPGVGPATATAIVRTREESPFAAPGELIRVPGIGPATLTKLLPHLRVNGGPRGASRADATRPRPSAAPDMAPRRDTRPLPPAMGPGGAGSEPVHINRADSVELQRLPGIGPALAGRIVRERQRNGPFGTVDDLTRVSGIGPLTINRLRPHARNR